MEILSKKVYFDLKFLSVDFFIFVPYSDFMLDLKALAVFRTGHTQRKKGFVCVCVCVCECV